MTLLPVLAVTTALSLLLPSGPAGAAEPGRISGTMFGDYYYVLTADDGDAALPQKRNAFQFRRLYFTYDRALSERFDVRFRLEANDPGFGSRERMTPFLKHAYLRWQQALLGGDLYLGESATPTWNLTEKVWGYRSVEKTVLDLNGIGSSADIGLALSGTAGPADYHFMVANGPGQRPEDDHGKKLYAAVDLGPGKGNHLELYADLDLRPDGRDRITLKALVGRSGKGFHGGAEPFLRIDRKAGVADPGADVTRIGVSLFGAAPVTGGWNGFGRLDVVRNDDRDATDLLVIAGLDRAITPDVHLMPNLYLQVPDGPDPNLQARVSALFQF